MSVGINVMYQKQKSGNPKYAGETTSAGVGPSTHDAIAS